MTAHDHDEAQGGVRERLGDVVHAVQEAVADRVESVSDRVESVSDRVEAVADRVAPVTDRVAPAVDAVTSALHEAGHTATHLVGRREADPQPTAAPELGPVPSGTQIVRPAKGSDTFMAWRDGRWAPVHREHGTGWIWSA